MTPLQLALVAGALVGLGVWLIVWWIVPRRVDLAAYLEAYKPYATANADALSLAAATGNDLRDRVGLWLMRSTPVTNLMHPPHSELQMLRIPLHRFYAEKFLFGVVGFIFPTLAGAVMSILGVPLPFYIPLGASLLVAAVFFVIPNSNLKEQARDARAEFFHGLIAYVDLLALERASGTAQRQAMEVAAEVGDSWVFKRLAEEFRRSRWSGRPPWDSLKALSVELDVPDLADVADIMRTSGEEGAAVAETLKARAASMRAAQQARDLATANAVSEKLVIPQSALFGVLLLMLMAPVGLRFLGL